MQKVMLKLKIDNKYKFFKTSYYKKNLEQISTTGNSKAIDEENKIILEADKFIYNKITIL